MFVCILLFKGVAKWVGVVGRFLKDNKLERGGFLSGLKYKIRDLNQLNQMERCSFGRCPLNLVHILITFFKKKPAPDDQEFVNWGSQRGVMTRVLDCTLEVSEFELQPRLYVHFWTITLGSVMNPFIPSNNGLNSNYICSSTRMALVLNPQRVVCYWTRMPTQFWNQDKTSDSEGLVIHAHTHTHTHICIFSGEINLKWHFNQVWVSF